MAATTAQAYTKIGAKAATPVKLDKAVFGVAPKNHDLLKLAYDAYLANSRPNLAITKTRGLVRGGGRKPHRQKGTGRARAGSSRGPIWTGGGITFGPSGKENYTKQLNTKAKRQAVRQALSLASADNKIIVIEDLSSKDGKTRGLSLLLSKIGAKRNTLVVVDQKKAELMQAARNISDIKIVSARYVTVYDVLNADCLVFSQAALQATTTWLAKTETVRSGKEAQ